MRTRRRLASVAVAFLVAFVPLIAGSSQPAAAQQVDCGEYLGLVCEGVLTDEPDVISEREPIEQEILRVTSVHGNPLAVVIATDSRGEDPVDFAIGIANDWGVGDPVEDNGILILVSIDERRTEIVTQAGVVLPGTAIANAARPFFNAGDFDGGVLAMVGAVDTALSGEPLPDSGSDQSLPFPGWAVLLLIATIGGFVLVGSLASNRRKRAASERASRERKVDAVLDQLQPRGDELELASSYGLSPPPGDDVSTSDGIAGLLDIEASRTEEVPDDVVGALARAGTVGLIDVEAMLSGTRVPLDLRATGERPILEDGLDGSVRKAASVSLSDDAAFNVALGELQDVVTSLRPHRVAAARRRAADTLSQRLVPTSFGSAYVTHLGSLVVRAAPVLDGQSPLAMSTSNVESAHRVARAKVERVTKIRKSISDSDTRDIAAVALADLSNDVDASVETFQTTLDQLESRGSVLKRDGLSLPAVAALLVMNNSAADIPRFVDGYQQLRASHDPTLSLEGALAGLFTASELAAAQREAKGLGLPVSIALALQRRRDDGVAVYRDLLDDVLSHSDGSDAQVIAGVLAMSLEPSIAYERWLTTRNALTSLGLEGTYVDVAAAFGASDPRGPEAFALAYAAQRSALEDSGYESLTRYAPEMAHAGTSDRTDTWTGRPLGTSPAEFDPFTFFFFHWAASGGRHGASGWNTLYRSSSWQDGGSSWWGGGGGFGSSGGSSWGSGGSSWGSGGFSGGSFGGFSGGGGFGGGGGGGW